MALFTTSELESFLGLAEGDLDVTRGALMHDLAASYLEGQLGTRFELVEGATVAYEVRWDDEWIKLPFPTHSVSAVSVDGDALDEDDWRVVDGRLHRSTGWGGGRWGDNRFARVATDEYVSVEVTLDYGFGDDSDGFPPPGELKLWALVLAKQGIEAPASGRQSVRVDDFSESYATNVDAVLAVMALPPALLGQLRARYGGSTVGTVRG